MSRPAPGRRPRRSPARSGLSVAGVLAALLILAVAIAVLPRHHHGAAPKGAARDHTTALAGSLASAMARPWPALQQPSGHFRPGVGGGSRYGDAMVGYALIQDGLRTGDHAIVSSGLRGIGYALARSRLHASPSVFESLAFASAYNLARARLTNDPLFQRVRGAWEDELRHITMIRLPATGYYGNHWLVEAVEVRELLRSGLRSTDPQAVLGGRRGEAGRLSVALINRRIPAMARQGSTRVRHRRTFVLSDPPDDPTAYQGLSLGFYARAVRLLGHRASAAARRTLLEAANASLWLTAPDGDVGWFGRNQEEAWSLAGTAYGASVAATTRGVGAPRAAALRTLADRTLVRLRDVHRIGRFGLNITPGVAQDPVAGARGVDPGAGGAPFAGLALALVDWSVPELQHARPGLGPLPLDRTGGQVVGKGASQFAVVRHGPVWFAVRAQGSGKHPYELRDDFGLVSVKLLRGGHWSDLMRLKPITNGKPDSAGPVLVSSSQPAFPFGDRMSVSRRGIVTIAGGYRTAASTFTRLVARLANGQVVNALDFTPGTLVRTATVFRFRPLRCGGVALGFTTQPGDVYEYSQFLASPPRAVRGLLSDSRSRVTFSPAGRLSIQDGYASGLDPRLWRARVRFPPSTGGQIKAALCASPASSSSPSPPPRSP